jgi:hypothetical protein
MGTRTGRALTSRSADDDLVSFFSLGGKKKMQRLFTILGGCKYHDGHERTKKTEFIGGQCLAAFLLGTSDATARAYFGFLSFFFPVLKSSVS